VQRTAADRDCAREGALFHKGLRAITPSRGTERKRGCGAQPKTLNVELRKSGTELGFLIS
jgi:hypothetical protein